MSLLIVLMFNGNKSQGITFGFKMRPPLSKQKQEHTHTKTKIPKQTKPPENKHWQGCREIRALVH